MFKIMVRGWDQTTPLVDKLKKHPKGVFLVSLNNLLYQLKGTFFNFKPQVFNDSPVRCGFLTSCR